MIRGIGSGVFEGLYPFSPGDYQERVAAKQVFPIVCEDELIGEPVGSVDLFGSSAQVMQHSMATESMSGETTKALALGHC